MTESVRESRLHEWLRDNAPDCGDNSCLFGGRGKGGVRTNGGCRCFKDLPTAKRIYVERLYEAFTQSESGLRPEDQFSMGDPHPCDMTAEERERAFTPSCTFEGRTGCSFQSHERDSLCAVMDHLGRLTTKDEAWAYLTSDEFSKALQEHYIHSASEPTLARALVEACSIGMSTIIAWVGAYETLSPYLKGKYGRLEALYKLGCDSGGWANGSDGGGQT